MPSHVAGGGAATASSLDVSSLVKLAVLISAANIYITTTDISEVGVLYERVRVWAQPERVASDAPAGNVARSVFLPWHGAPWVLASGRRGLWWGHSFLLPAWAFVVIWPALSVFVGVTMWYAEEDGGLETGNLSFLYAALVAHVLVSKTWLPVFWAAIRESAAVHDAFALLAVRGPPNLLATSELPPSVWNAVRAARAPGRRGDGGCVAEMDDEPRQTAWVLSRGSLVGARAALVAAVASALGNVVSSIVVVVALAMAAADTLLCSAWVAYAVFTLYITAVNIVVAVYYWSPRPVPPRNDASARWEVLYWET